MRMKMSNEVRHMFPPLLCLYTAMLCTVVQAATETQDADNILPNDLEINIWVDGAPLELMVGQLAQMSGRLLSVEGELEGHVSGRFTGTVSDTLTVLSSTHSILFDLTDDALQAVSKDAQSSVSIALSGPQMDEQFVALLSSENLPGNTVKLRDDSVHISGHPEFVKRVTRQITSTMAEDIGSKRADNIGSDAPALQDLVSEMVAATATPVLDAGAQAMLQDMKDESLPETERAALSKPIRWVTDVPGYTTF